MAITPTDISNESLVDSSEVIFEAIVEYATTSPENINANVLRSMLYEFAKVLLSNSSSSTDVSEFPPDLPTGPSGGAV